MAKVGLGEANGGRNGTRINGTRKYSTGKNGTRQNGTGINGIFFLT